MINDNTLGRIEACIYLCCSAEDFKKKVLQVTNLSADRFHDLGVTDVAYQMIEEGEGVEDIINAVG